jgi:hypothetical membrane protein
LTLDLLVGIVNPMEAHLANTRKAHRLYAVIAIGCAMFVILTLVAMLTYTGGWVDNHAARGYSFTQNFLSNLGMLTALSGRPNWASATLFFIALAGTGACLVIFFVIFPRLFQHRRLQKLLSLLGSIVGVLAGLSFMGIAFAPADVARAAHIQFVMWAFRLFPLAVLLYLPVMFIDQQYPKLYAWVFAVFCLLLIGYFLLLTNGPSLASPQGLVIQVVGQKVIAYASIVSIFIQSLGAYIYTARVGTTS